MSNRDQILADFQACTDITDFGEAFSILESSGWNLEDAVNTALAIQEDMPGGSGMAVTGARIPTDPSRGLDETGHGGRALSESPLAQTIFPDTRRNETYGNRYRQTITFTADFENETVTVNVSDSLTFGEVKALLVENAGSPGTPLTFVWIEPEIQCLDYDQLYRLDLPSSVRLKALSCETPQIETMSLSDDAEDCAAANISSVYKFTIEVDEEDIHTILNIQFEGSQTVEEVKIEAAGKSGIPRHSQIWEGWPQNAEDDTVLAFCDLTRPVQKLTLQRAPEDNPLASLMRTTQSNHSMRNHQSNNSLTRCTQGNTQGSDEEMDDHFDFDDSFEVRSNPRRGPLMPKEVHDARESTKIFNAEFIQRYSAGDSHPIFYEGDLREALQDSLHCNPDQRRPLAVYLHHEDSLITNIYCSNVLCSEVISNYLNANFVCWGWDLTELENKQRLLTQCLEVLGNSTLASASGATNRREVTTMIRNFTSDDLPQILFFSKVRGAVEIMASVRACNTPEELLNTLITYQQLFEDHRDQDAREVGERYAREDIKRQQDEAYEQSLANDRIKEAQRQRDEQARKDSIRDEERKKQQLEEEKQSAAEGLPDEPSEHSNDRIAKIRFRCPNGEMLQRRFLAIDKFRILLNFLLTKGYNVSEFRIMTTFPRKDISQEEKDKSLEELQLFPQETLILESRS